jgi:hypothetical protein
MLVPAHATTTVSGGDPGTNPPVVRQDSVTIKQDTGAQFYYRTASTAAGASNTAFTDETQGGFLVVKAFNRACIGNNPAVGGKNNSPRDTITVKDPLGAVIATQVSPARNTNASGAPPLNPQPAPNDTNYLGDFPGTGGTHGMSFTVSLAGKPAGTYTVTTVTQNMIKTDTTFVAGTCQIGYPSPTNNKLAVLGAVTTTTTFEYRPWQNTFVDVLGAGKVFSNTTPNEFEFTIGNLTSAIYGAGYQKFYSLPASSTFLLPSDPAACAANPAGCLPSTATLCLSGDACTPRLMTINKTSGTERLQGIFDLQTKAFYAGAYINGTERLLVSLGTAQDAAYHALLAQLVTAAASKGIGLQALLATQIRLADGQNALTVSLLNGLQIQPSTAKGLQIVTDPSVQAGIILDIYVSLAPTTCVTNSASSATAPQRYTPTTGVGYMVERSDLLPSVPAVGPLAAIVGGPIYHIVGNFAAPLVDTASAVIGLDSAADEPNGYPVWIEPFLSSGHVTSPRTMDYLGTATWSASETSLGAFGCLVTDFMVGTGVALYNNPLPVGFGTLLSPLYTPNAAAATLTTEINTAVQGVVTQVSSNPTVSSLLTQLTGALPLG